MRHSKKKADQTPLPVQNTMGSENDFAPGGTAGGTAAGDPSFDVSGSTPAADGSEVTVATNTEATENRAESEVTGERDRYLRLAAEYDNYRKRSAKERQDAG